MKKLIILASGSGTNAENIIKYFENSDKVQVAFVLTNKSSAGVLKRCDKLNVPAFYFNREAFTSSTLLNFIKAESPDLIVLAGFLWKIPEAWVHEFPDQIVNIHPALLPKYGGKGMYGRHVHNAVKESGDIKSGITIHYVNEDYDEGSIIFQAETDISPKDSIEIIASKVHELEYRHYPQAIENLLING